MTLIDCDLLLLAACLAYLFIRALAIILLCFVIPLIAAVWSLKNWN